MSAGPTVKAALFTACGTLYPAPALVCYGLPIQNQPDDIISIGTMTAQVETDSMALTRMETIDVLVTFSCFRGGVDQQTVTERAFTLLASLESYLRNTDPTIGGSCLRNTGVVSWALDDENPTQQGVIADITATVRVMATS